MNAIRLVCWGKPLYCSPAADITVATNVDLHLGQTRPGSQISNSLCLLEKLPVADLHALKNEFVEQTRIRLLCLYLTRPSGINLDCKSH